MSELPPELWLRIAHFTPDRDLFRLASVNRLFLDIVLDRRYRSLIIDNDQPEALIAKLARIKRDPQVAARVQSLTIHPKAVRSACLKAAKSAKGRLRPVQSRHWPEAFRLRTEKVPLEEDVLLADQFLDCLSYLHGVEVLSIEWNLGADAENAFCIPFLGAICSLHASGLRVLRLDMMLSHLCNMVEPLSILQRLQVLSIHFTTTDKPPELASQTRRVLEDLAAFVNGLAPTLQNLSISSIGHADLSCLFDRLQQFPHLTSLSLAVPCDPRHISNPIGFRNFLLAHRRIEKLSFSPQYCCSQSALPPDPQHGLATTEIWLEHAFGDVEFEDLQSLELGLNILGSGGKRVLPPVPRIGSAAKYTSSLRILGCMISLEDTRTLLYPFSQAACGTNPRRLALEVHVLTTELLDLLASYLPGLEMLDLTYRWVGISGNTDVHQFVKEMLKTEYPSWTSLCELALRCSRHDDDSRRFCQQAVANAIPRLRRR